MSLLGGLLGVLNLEDLIAKLLIGKAKLAEMKAAPVGGEVEMPDLRTKVRGAGYWSIPMGPATRIK